MYSFSPRYLVFYSKYVNAREYGCFVFTLFVPNAQNTVTGQLDNKHGKELVTETYQIALTQFHQMQVFKSSNWVKGELQGWAKLNTSSRKEREKSGQRLLYKT